MTPMVVVAETRPFCAERGPVREASVRALITAVVELSTWMVEEAPIYRVVPVAFVNASCGKVLTEEVVAVKKKARTSPNTSSLESEVVPVAPITTWFVVVEV